MVFFPQEYAELLELDYFFHPNKRQLLLLLFYPILLEHFLTNDGDFANHVTHPSSETEKEYIVKVDQDILKKDMDDAYRGLVQPYRIKSYKLLSKREVSVVLTEGKNREIRNLFDMMGYEVKKLTRIRIGDVLLGELQSGRYRRMTKAEIQSLRGGKGHDSRN